MTQWEYKSLTLDRIGNKEDFSFKWTYTGWELAAEGGGKQPMMTRLQALGKEGWELVGVVPSDLWDEGGRSVNSAHGVRAIACVLLFKRPLPEKSAAPLAAAAPAAPAASTPAPDSPSTSDSPASDDPATR